MAKKKRSSKNISKKKRENILDKVIESNIAKEKTAFDPIRMVTFIVQALPPRPQEVIKERFGLEEGEGKTLQQIGENFGITRERVRQIENQARQTLEVKLQTDDVAEEIIFIRNAFKEVGGISSLDFISERLLGPEKTNPVKRNNVIFLLEISNDFIKFPGDSIIRPGYSIEEEYINQAREITSFIANLLRRKKRPFSEKDLFLEIKKGVKTRDYLPRYSKEALKAILDLSEEIDLNPFGEWGLWEWSDISPASIRDKAYIVLKKHGKPAHFIEVSDLINQVRFDSRKANPGTVHNELIKDERFVLVGRGVYALSEWGFKKGTVLDVIKEVLRESPRHLSQKEIVEKALEERQVQVNTILLALKDKGIKKDEKGRFWV